MSQEKEIEKKGKGTQWIQLAVVVVALAIVAYFVIRFVMSFIWWIVAFMGIAVLLINRKMVSRIFNYLRNLYKKNKVLGITGTIGGLVAFTPFMGFLLLKTIWDFRKSNLMGKKEEKDAGKVPIDIEEVGDLSMDLLDNSGNDMNAPPNAQ